MRKLQWDVALIHQCPLSCVGLAKLNCHTTGGISLAVVAVSLSLERGGP